VIKNAEIVRARIHPAIGIARVGNGSDYFYGPELPYANTNSAVRRDPKGRLNRQVARFRIYGLNSRGDIVTELNPADSGIQVVWTVHVANRKASWYEFLIALDCPEAACIDSPMRNAKVHGKSREKLDIDPGVKVIRGINEGPVPLCGCFLDLPVVLGELRTDGAGRLLVIPGRGVSGPALPEFKLAVERHYLGSNDGWFDDVCDGPVSASVKLRGRVIPVEAAWVVTAPPNYCPDITPVVTMFDVVTETVAGIFSGGTGRPSFARDIYPIFLRLSAGQWVNKGLLETFGHGSPNDFTLRELSVQLADAGDRSAPLRQRIFAMFRDPESTTFQSELWPPIYGDSFGFDNAGPRARLALTKTMYRCLRSWTDGDFEADFDQPQSVPTCLEDLPLQEQPATLDRAALEACSGGPFRPGYELTWPMRHASIYRAVFRLKEKPPEGRNDDYGEFLTQAKALSPGGPLACFGAGDLTRWLGLPWQSDAAGCRFGYEKERGRYLPAFWPARLPNHILTEDAYRVANDLSRPLPERIAAFGDRSPWMRPLGLERSYPDQVQSMVAGFDQLGVLQRRPGPVDSVFPDDIYVESHADSTIENEGLGTQNSGERDQWPPKL
jgi:hypothetical protein